MPCWVDVPRIVATLVTSLSHSMAYGGTKSISFRVSMGQYKWLLYGWTDLSRLTGFSRLLTVRAMLLTPGAPPRPASSRPVVPYRPAPTRPSVLNQWINQSVVLLIWALSHGLSDSIGAKVKSISPRSGSKQLGILKSIKNLKWKRSWINVSKRCGISILVWLCRCAVVGGFKYID